jgi:prostatic aicd phosphatase
MFPPKGTSLEWNRELNWLPIVYGYEDLDKDSLLLVRKTCPRYHEELERVLAEDAKNELEDNKILFEELSNATGMAIKTPDDVQSLYSTLKAEVCRN